MEASRYRPLGARFYRRRADLVAPDLLGRYLIRCVAGKRTAVGRVVEVEAYLGADDPASHAAGGRRTRRTATMYLAGGVAYVYLIYGLHHCVNVVCGREDEAQAVLIRAIEPVEGVRWMSANRGLAGSPRRGQIGGGPGKLCQALAIDRSFDGASLLTGELVVAAGVAAQPEDIARGPRVGVDYSGVAATWPLRFGIHGHREMSRPLLRRDQSNST